MVAPALPSVLSHFLGIVTVIGAGSPQRIGRDWWDEAGTRPHYRHRFPAEIISHAVWLYHVFSLSLRDRRVATRRAGHSRLIRERPTMVCQVRYQLCQQPSSPPTETPRQVAFGRGVHSDPGAASLSLACSGSGRRSPRHSCPKSSKYGRGKEVLQTTAPGPAVCSTCDRDRLA